jgi:hypothetical protein
VWLTPLHLRWFQHLCRAKHFKTSGYTDNGIN